MLNAVHREGRMIRKDVCVGRMICGWGENVSNSRRAFWVQPCWRVWDRRAFQPVSSGWRHTGLEWTFRTFCDSRDRTLLHTSPHIDSHTRTTLLRWHSAMRNKKQLRLWRTTLTFESLSKQPVQHWAAVFAECRRDVVIHLKPMRNVDVEPFRQHLQLTRQSRHL